MYPGSITTIQHAHRGLAQSNKRRGSAAPSPKAQEIFRRIEINCEKQCDVAGDLKISPGRVSQHVSRVRAWLAAGSPGDAQTMAHFDQQRLERRLAKDRHQLILEMAIRELHRLQDNHKHITTKVEEGDKIKTTTTAKDQALSVQHMKIAQKAIAELQKLAELEPLPQPRPAMPGDHDLFRAVRDVLCDWRQRAEHLRHVAPSNWEELVGAVIAALLGRNRDPLPLDEPAREFIDNLLRGNAGRGNAGGTVPERSDSKVEAEAASGESANLSQTGGSQAESCIVPPVPRDPHWNPFVTGAFSDLGEPIVRHPEPGSGVRGQESGKTERQSEGETERKAERPDAVPPSVTPSSSAAHLQPPKDTSPTLPPTRPPEPSATNPTSTTSSASSAVDSPHPPSSDEKIKNITPIPPVTSHAGSADFPISAVP